MNDTVGVAALAFFYEVTTFGHLWCLYVTQNSAVLNYSINDNYLSLFFALGVHRRKPEIQSSDSGFRKNSI